MDIAQNWPVLTSYDHLLAYARSKGGRLPTEPELRLFFDKYDVGFEGGANSGFRNWHPVPLVANLSSMIPAHQIVTGQQQGLRNMQGRAQTVVSGNGRPPSLIPTRDCHLRIFLLGLFLTFRWRFQLTFGNFQVLD
jgi:hypothetical protein